MPIRDLTRKLLKTLSKKNKTHKSKRQYLRGGKCGCGSKQSGGSVIKPVEYYGGNSKRYHKLAPTPEDHAYGKTNAVSFGSISDDMLSTGPNLGPYPNSSGMMTGGRKQKKNRGGCSRSKKSNKSNMRRKKTRSNKSCRSSKTSKK